MFRIDFIPFLPRVVSGLILIMLGLIVYVTGIIAVMSAYNAKRLGTKGILALCRNPDYSAWDVFIIPGIMLLFNSGIGLTAFPVLYLSLRILVKKKEDYLEKTFGGEYRAYIKQVPAVIPLGKLARF